MKKLKTFIIFGMVLLSEGCCYLGNCEDDTLDDLTGSSLFEPIYLAREELDNSIALENSKEILNSGKIYIINNLLFINDVRKGFHVFDNTDTTNPQKIKFIAAPGSTDLVVKNDILYINQATDLITVKFNLSTNSLIITKRVENIFPELISPDGFYAYDTPQNSIVVEWLPKN